MSIQTVAQAILNDLHSHWWNTGAYTKQHNGTYLNTGAMYINVEDGINWATYDPIFDVNCPLTVSSLQMAKGLDSRSNHDPQVCLMYLQAVSSYKTVYPSDTTYDLPNGSGSMGISQFVDHICAQGTGTGAGDFKPQLGTTNYGGYSNPKGWVYFALLQCYLNLQNSPLLTAQQVLNLKQATQYAAWTYYNAWYLGTFTDPNLGNVTIKNIVNTSNSKAVNAYFTGSGTVAAGTTSLNITASSGSLLANIPVAGYLTITDAVNGNETCQFYNYSGSGAVQLVSGTLYAHAQGSGSGVTISVPIQTIYTYSPSQSLLCAAAMLDAVQRWPTEMPLLPFYPTPSLPQDVASWKAAAQAVITTITTGPGLIQPYNMYNALLTCNLGRAADVLTYSSGQLQAKIETQAEAAEALVRISTLLNSAQYLTQAAAIINACYSYGIWDSTLKGFLFGYDMAGAVLLNSYKETRSTALMLRAMHLYNLSANNVFVTRETDIVTSLLAAQPSGFLISGTNTGYLYRLNPDFSIFHNSYTTAYASTLAQASAANAASIVVASSSGLAASTYYFLVLDQGVAGKEEQVVFKTRSPLTTTLDVVSGNALLYSHASGATITTSPPYSTMPAKNNETQFTSEAEGSTLSDLLFTLLPALSLAPNPLIPGSDGAKQTLEGVRLYAEGVRR